MFTGQWPDLLDWMESEGMAGDLKENHQEVIEKLNDLFFIFGMIMNREEYARFLEEDFKIRCLPDGSPPSGFGLLLAHALDRFQVTLGLGFPVDPLDHLDRFPVPGCRGLRTPT